MTQIVIRVNAKLRYQYPTKNCYLNRHDESLGGRRITAFADDVFKAWKRHEIMLASDMMIILTKGILNLKTKIAQNKNSSVATTTK